MNPVPPIASTISSNIADLFTKPLSVQRFASIISDILPPTPTTSVAMATVDSLATVDPTPTNVACPTVVDTAVTTSNSVPALHPNSTSVPTPIVLDTGASFTVTPFASDFILVSQALYGLIPTFTSVTSVASNSKATPIDPHTLITGEDTATDLSSPDSDSVEFELASTIDSFDI